MRQIGDTVFVEATGEFSPGIQCVVLEISKDDGRVTKMKAAIPDDRLGKMGFICEGDDWIVVEWSITLN